MLIKEITQTMVSVIHVKSIHKERHVGKFVHKAK